MTPEYLAQMAAAAKIRPEVQALASALRLIECPSDGAAPPIRIEMPEPSRIAEALYAKGVRWQDPNSLDPAGRITEILAALSHDGLEDAREIVGLILQGYSARQALENVKGVTDEQVAHTSTQSPPSVICTPLRDDEGPGSLSDPS